MRHDLRDDRFRIRNLLRDRVPLLVRVVLEMADVTGSCGLPNLIALCSSVGIARSEPYDLLLVVVP